MRPTLSKRIAALERTATPRLSDEERAQHVLCFIESPVGTPGRRRVLEILADAAARPAAATGNPQRLNTLRHLLAEERAKAREGNSDEQSTGETA